MKIVSIVGARPQFVKAATLSRELSENKNCNEILVHTGQHYDANMSDVFFQEMEIPEPHYNLGIGSASQGAMTGKMLESIEEVLLKEKPDWTLVYGDTNSTLAGALASVKLHIPVAHVEAGLRSFNRAMPEEINRILTDHCSDLLFTPSSNATVQLQKEGISLNKISEVGDIMYDTILYYQQKACAASHILEKLFLDPRQYVLATIHRTENTDNLNRLKEIFYGLNSIAEEMPVVLPLHPRTKKVLEANQWANDFSDYFLIIEPVGYFDMLMLEKNSSLIFTDSGGVQKEAYFFEIPCLTLREETEWTELLEHGYNRLVAAERHTIFNNFCDVLNKNFPDRKSLYGDGSAAKKIVKSILKENL